MRYQPQDIPPARQRDYDRMEPPDDHDEDVDDEDAESRAIVRRVKMGRPVEEE